MPIPSSDLLGLSLTLVKVTTELIMNGKPCWVPCFRFARGLSEMRQSFPPESSQAVSSCDAITDRDLVDTGSTRSLRWESQLS